VNLINPATSAVLRTVKTGASGTYLFFNIARGSYRLRVSHENFAAPLTVPLTLEANTVKNLGLTAPPSIEEKALNAFGDRWSLARPNPWLRQAAATGCYRRPASGMSANFTDQELQFHARLAAKFYVEGCATILENDPPYGSLADVESSALLKKHVAKFKAANPSLKYLGYTRLSDCSMGQVGWKEIQNHKGWFVYEKGSTTQSEDKIVQTLAGTPLLDVTNPAYQNYIAARLAKVLPYYQIDGLLIDSVSPFPKLADPSKMPNATRLAWEKGWVAILKKLKAAIGPNRYIFASVPQDGAGFAKKIVPVVDGIMLEDTFSPIRRKDILTRIAAEQPLIDAAAAAGKWVLTTQNTKVDGSVFGKTTPAKEHAKERYYLAAFYIFSKGKMLFYYNPPSATTPQYGSEAFFTDWNIKVGAKRGPYSPVPGRQRVFSRNYENAIIYLNASNNQYKIIVPKNSQFKLDPGGKPIVSYVMPPKSGFILSRAQAFQ
jgi:hypothetical protein